MESAPLLDNKESSDDDSSEAPRRDNMAPPRRWGIPITPNFNRSVPEQRSPDRSVSFGPMFANVLPKIKSEESLVTVETDDDDDSSDQETDKKTTVAEVSAGEDAEVEAVAQTEQADSPLLISTEAPAGHTVLESYTEPFTPAEVDSFGAGEEVVTAAEDVEPEHVTEMREDPTVDMRESYADVPLDHDHEESIPLASAAGGGTPPKPPRTPWESSGAFEPGSEPSIELDPPSREWRSSAGLETTAYAASAAAPAERIITAQDVRERQRRSFRNGVVAGAIAMYVAHSFVANRRMRRYERSVEKQNEASEARFTTLQAEQTRTQSQLNTQAEQFAAYRQRAEAASTTKPTAEQPKTAEVVQLAPEQQIFDAEGNEIVLQPGQRIERSAGGYSVVVDQHNRIVHNAIRYGEAYLRDQKREQVSDDAFATADDDQPIDAQTTAALPAAHMIVSGQVDWSHQLQPGVPTSVDPQHRLPKSRSPLTNVAGNPWLWTAIAFLLIIYFIAALA
jgi:hypothetical protein